MPSISISCIDRLVQEPGGALLKVYLILRSMAGNDATKVQTSIAAIAARAGITDRTATAMLTELETLGFIRREDRSPGPFMYTFTFVEPEQALTAGPPAPIDLQREHRECPSAFPNVPAEDPVTTTPGFSPESAGIVLPDETAPYVKDHYDLQDHGQQVLHHTATDVDGADHHDSQSRRIASWYRPLTDREETCLQLFITRDLGRDFDEFLRIVTATESGVCSDAPFPFLLRVMQTMHGKLTAALA